MKPALHPKLSHLSAEQIEGLIARYDAGARTRDLISDFGIDARPADLLKLLPARVLEAERCPHCDINLWQKHHSRSSRFEPDPYCPACGHVHFDTPHQRCSCRGCRQHAPERHASIEEMKRRLVSETYPQAAILEDADVDLFIGRLTLRDMVYVTALYRNWHVDERGMVGPPYSKERPLAPTRELARDILAHLTRRGVIAVSPASPSDAFEFNDELTQVTAHFIYKVQYRLFPMLAVGLIAEVLRGIDELAKDGYWNVTNHGTSDESLTLWQEVALHECLETFRHQGQLHGFEPPSGEKTILTFRSLLEDFSVAQIYNIVWAAARNAAAYYQRGGVSKSQAANSMVGSCRTRGDKARVEGWEIKPYNRNFDRPRSELSHVLHDVFLEIGELGFTQKPSREILKLDNFSPLDASASGEETPAGAK